MTLQTRERCIPFPRRPLVMGIVNINDDSFCGDGTLDVSQALAQAQEQLGQGADIIDIGAESARTNRPAITVAEEIARLLPFIAQWPALLARSSPHDPFQIWPPLLSINTWRSEVIAQILPHGGDIINDLSALPAPEIAALCARHSVALIIMHSVGEPKIPHTHIQYCDIMQELDRFFEAKIQLATAAGLHPQHIILDPGIDFAKQRDDNLTIYRQLTKLARFGRPILLPVSRKTVIHHVLDQPDPLDRDPGTVACITAGHQRGASIFRVHNVTAAVQALKICESIFPAVPHCEMR